MKNGIQLVTVFALGAGVALASLRAGLLHVPMPHERRHAAAPHEQAHNEAAHPGTPPTAAASAPAPAPVVSVVRSPRFVACDASAAAPTLEAVKLAETDGKVWALHCGASVELVAIEGGPGSGSIPRRIAHLEAHAPSPGLSLRPAPVLASDVSGDGRRDLIVGFRFHDPTGAPRSGAVYELLRDAHGSFGAQRSLGSLPLVAAASAHFVSSDVFDLALIGLQDARLGLPSDLALLRGGPAPLRIQAAKLGVDAKSAISLDLNLDAHDDLIVVSTQPTAELLYFDAQGAIRERTAFEVVGAQRAFATDGDGDGHADAVIAGDALSFVLAQNTYPPLRVDVIANSAALRSVQAADVDADGKTDFIAYSGLDVVALVQRGPLSFERRVLCKLPSAGPTPLAIDVVAQDPAGLTLLVVASSAEAPTRIELGLMSCTADASNAWQARSEPLQNAALSLRFDLQ